MVFEVTVEDVKEQLNHHAAMVAAGTDDTGPEWEEWLGAPVTLWRRFRDGEETQEELPYFIALCTLAAIPECEPQVERAKILHKESNDADN